VSAKWININKTEYLLNRSLYGKASLLSNIELKEQIPDDVHYYRKSYNKIYFTKAILRWKSNMNQRNSYLLFSDLSVLSLLLLLNVPSSLFWFLKEEHKSLYPWYISLSQLLPLPELNASFCFSGEVLFKDLLLFVSIPVSVLSSSSLTGPPRSSFVRYLNSPPAYKQTKQTQNTSGLKEALYTRL